MNPSQAHFNQGEPDFFTTFACCPLPSAVTAGIAQRLFPEVQFSLVNVELNHDKYALPEENA